MDFSAINPQSSNSLNLAARANDVLKVKRMLKKHNPNIVDNRGWTCLHEAAANDSYECLLLIIRHPDCRLLAETYEGHTALYLACRKNCSLRTIKLLLEHIEDIANYASTEMVSPLHVVSSQGRTDAVQMLIDHGALIAVQDFDGDTPLHDAAFKGQSEVISVLLHAGAQPEKRNESDYTPLHLACFSGCLKTVIALYPFVTNIDQQAGNGETALILATQRGSIDIVEFLLQHNADPHIKNVDEELPLNVALIQGHSSIFKILLSVTDKEKINEDIIVVACKPHYFNMDIIVALLESDLGPEFFNVTEKLYVTLERIGDFVPNYEWNAPLNSFLHICEYIYNQSQELFKKLFYLFLMRGPAVNSLYLEECPPLVYIHYCEHNNCFDEVLQILLEQGCDVDYKSSFSHIPDVFIASLATGDNTAFAMLQYSLVCEPTQLMRFVFKENMLARIPSRVLNKILSMVDVNSEGLNIEKFSHFIPTLKHLCRVEIRKTLKRHGPLTTTEFIKHLECIPLPPILRMFLRYN